MSLLTTVEKCSFVDVGVPGVYKSSRNVQKHNRQNIIYWEQWKKTVMIIIKSCSISKIYAIYAYAQLCRIPQHDEMRVECLRKMFVSEFSDTTKMLHMHHKNLFGESTVPQHMILCWLLASPYIHIHFALWNPEPVFHWYCAKSEFVRMINNLY